MPSRAPDELARKSGGGGWPCGIEWTHGPKEELRSMTTTVNICRIDCACDDAHEAILGLRRQLSPKGNVVSPQGRARTIAAFGEPLSPQQVVETICADVRSRGLAAVLDYTQRLDHVTLEPSAVRVSEQELADAHRAADPA